MNSYQINLLESAGGSPEYFSLLKVIGYAFLYSQNISLTNDGILTFSLPFRFSESLLNGRNMLQTVNDTSSSFQVFSSLPYATQGCLALARFDQLDFSSVDFDNYIKLPTTSERFIYLGISSTTKTDFYTPFSNAHSGYVVFLDVQDKNLSNFKKNFDYIENLPTLAL